jgi:hypothetical protein
MNAGDLQRYKRWFESYTQTFLDGDEEDRANIALKIEHTHNVCRLIVRIAGEETTDHTLKLLAETVALFHDVGRFPQYAQYRTFRDSISVNHGRLGAETLTREKVLKGLPEEEQGIILEAVRFHNAFSIADLESPAALFCLRLVRDADKLDIWRIFLEFFENGKGGLTAAAGLGLPDTPEYSEEIVAAICAKKTASLASMKSLNDFILLQLSWIYDLNFRPAVKILMEHLLRTLDEYAREQLKKPGPRFS